MKLMMIVLVCGLMLGGCRHSGVNQMHKIQKAQDQYCTHIHGVVITSEENGWVLHDCVVPMVMDGTR